MSKYKTIFVQSHNKKIDLLKPILLDFLDFEKGVYLLKVKKTSSNIYLFQAKSNSIIQDSYLEIRPYKYKGVKGQIEMKLRIDQKDLYDKNFLFNLRRDWGFNSFVFNLLIEV